MTFASVTSDRRLATRRSPHIIGSLAVVLSTACVGPDRLTEPRAGVGVQLVHSSVSKTVSGQFIVTLNSPSGDTVAVDDLVRQSHGKLRHRYRGALNGFSATMSDQAAEQLRRNPRVKEVEADRYVFVSDLQSPAPAALDRIDQRLLPLNASYQYSGTGNGVHIYILDTGIRATHTLFGGRADGVFNAVDDTLGTSDCNGHGTHVAGIIGSSTYGVAKHTLLHAVRVLNCAGSGTNSALIAGIDWVMANRHGPAVINLSLSGEYSTAINQAVANAVAAGIVVVAAAGNNAADACNYSPGSAPAALTIGAINGRDERAPFSNGGACVDLHAPGVDVPSTWNNDDAPLLGFAVRSGTSMAAPHVAGAAAIALESNPTATPAQIAASIVDHATTNVLTQLMAGSPNRLLYLGSAPDVPPAPTPPPPSVLDNPPKASFTSNCPRGRCTFDAAGSSDDKRIVDYAWDFGDGTRSSSASYAKVAHAYSVAGNFTVTLTVTDGSGQSARTQQVVKVRKT